MDPLNESPSVAAEPAEPISRLHRIAYYTDILWIFGLTASVFCVFGSYLPCEGETLEWGVYMALGMFVPLGVAGVGVLHLAARLRTISAALRLILAVIGVISTGLLWLYSIPSTAVLAPLLGAITGALYVFCVPVSGEKRFKQRLAFAAIVFLTSTSAWVAAPRILYWTSLNKWVHASESWYSPVIVILVTALTAAGLFAWDRRDRSKAPLFLITRWTGHIVALAAFLWMGLRTDCLFKLTAVHHWSFWIGPAQSVREGGWLLWDVPSQYGFLSILTLALWPARDVWQALFSLQAILLSAVAFMIYWLFRQWSRGFINYVFALLATIAAVYFMSGMVYDLSGPEPWLSVGAMRFLWCHAALMALWYCLARPTVSPRRYLWIGGGLWLIGVFWSSESAIYATSVFGAGSAVLFLQALVPGVLRRRPWKRAAADALPFLLAPVIGLACVVALIEAYYRVRLGHGPEWYAYWEYATCYSNGFGSMPVMLSDSLWVLVGIFCIASAAVCWQFRTDPLNPRLAVLAGVWGAVWSTASYYVSRSHPNNVNNLAPVYFMALAILLPLVQGSPKPFRHALLHTAFPILLIATAAPYAHPSFPSIFTKVQRCRTHIATLLPTMDRRVRAFLQACSVSPEQPFACNYANAMLPLPLSTNPATGEVVGFDRTWLPRPLVMLTVLSPERQRTYVERHIQRWRMDGWLLMKGSLDSFDTTLKHQLEHFYQMQEVKHTDAWRLYWCRFRGVDDHAGKEQP